MLATGAHRSDLWRSPKRAGAWSMCFIAFGPCVTQDMTAVEGTLRQLYGKRRHCQSFLELVQRSAYWLAR